MATYYEILGVGKDATLNELKKAYRDKVEQYRSDNDEKTREVVDSIREAFLILSNDKKRKDYDNLISDFEEEAFMDSELSDILSSEMNPMQDEELLLSEDRAELPDDDFDEEDYEAGEEDEVDKEIYDRPKFRYRRSLWWIYPLIAVVLSASLFLIFFDFGESDWRVFGDDNQETSSSLVSDGDALPSINWDSDDEADNGYYLFSVDDKIYSIPGNMLLDFLKGKEGLKILSKQERYTTLYKLLEKTDPLFNMSLETFSKNMENESYRKQIFDKIKATDKSFRVSFRQFDEGIASPEEDIMRYYVDTVSNDVEFLPERFANLHDRYQPKNNKEESVVEPTTKPTEEPTTKPTVKPEEPTTPPVSTTRLKTGTSPYASYFGSGMYSAGALNHLTLSNRSNRDAVVVLVDARTGEHVRNSYVQAGKTLTLKDVPDGSYQIKASYGNDWQPDLDNGSRNPKGGFANNSVFKAVSGRIDINAGSDVDYSFQLSLDPARDNTITKSDFFSK